jgi:NodT family efflux transporter outer membrane factor (OMF) lipoprotein
MSSRSTISSRPTIALLCAALTLAGCDTGHGPVQPKLDLPAAWNTAAPQAATTWPAADWWRAFGSPELDSLIAAAQANNLDIAAAAARVQQASAQLRVAGAPLLPQVDFGSDVRQRGPAIDPDVLGSQSSSLKNDFGGSGSTRQRSSLDLGITARYELDFWGRNRDLAQAAGATLQASRYDKETVALTVTAGVASTYFEILALRDRMAVARDSLVTAQEVERVVESKARNGAVSPLDLAQQRAAVAAAEAAISPLQLQESQAINALALLLGRNPEGFTVAGAGIGALTLPSTAAGLPSGLLTRRPDIAAAEANLVTANANLNAARAAMLPSIDLNLGVTAEALLTNFAFGGAGAAYSAAASLTQPIFDAGALKGQKDVSAGKQLELVQTYKSTILAAFADVENALASVNNLKAQRQAVETEAAQAGTALGLAQAQYRAGAIDMLPVLDAQRSRAQAEDQRLTIQLSQLQAAVALYKALGGGWQAPTAAVDGGAADGAAPASLALRN